MRSPYTSRCRHPMWGQSGVTVTTATKADLQECCRSTPAARPLGNRLGLAVAGNKPEYKPDNPGYTRDIRI